MNDLVNLTKEQVDALVQSEVEKALSNRDEAAARQAMEEALGEAREVFEALKASIQEKKDKIAEYEGIFANLELDPTAAEVAANERIVELETSLEDWKMRAEVAEAALTTLHLEEIAATRMQELEEAGVSLDTEEQVKEQYAKIREMSDVQFESYKSELLALKAKYYSAPEGVGDEAAESAELSAEDVVSIAQTLGCDPADAKCISMVKEVAEKTAELSAAKRKKMMPSKKSTAPSGSAQCSEEDPNSAATASKETASAKLSLGEAISKSMDHLIEAPAGMREEIAALWADLNSARRDEKLRK